MFDDTFAGIHQLAWFDWAIMIPYFGILGILSIYGMHRFDTIHTYFKHRKKATSSPPQTFSQLPPVTIQLPLYNERYVLERLIDEVVKIEYPRELLSGSGSGAGLRSGCRLRSRLGPRAVEVRAHVPRRRTHGIGANGINSVALRRIHDQQIRARR